MVPQHVIRLTNNIFLSLSEYYGIYISPDLTQGYTYPCETFDNDFLTPKKDFLVDDIEVSTF